MALTEVRPARPGGPDRKRSAWPWLVIVGLFAVTAAYIIVAVPRNDVPPPTTRPAPSAPADGLSDRYDEYTLVPVTLPSGRGTGLPVAFRITGPDGSPATAYTPVQTMPLHLYVVREDLAIYQHLHPRLDGDTWRAEVDVPDGGVYRVYTEFTPVERAGAVHPHLLSVRFIIPGDTRPYQVPAPQATVKVHGFTVRRLDGTARLPGATPSILKFEVLDPDGRPVTNLEPYLGTYAHMSAFDVLTQAMTHMHPLARSDGRPPADGILTFHTAWAAYGEQRLFLQFKVAGRVLQVAFTVAVS
jgi:hypothetical protein